MPTDLQNEQWDFKFQKLLEFRKQHGHCSVPKKHTAYGLGRWVSKQRCEYRRFHTGKSGPRKLSQDRIDRLNEIGFCWNVDQAGAPLHNDDVAIAPSASATLLPPSESTKDPRPSFSSSTASCESKNDIIWNAMFQKLVAYKKEHGDCQVHHATEKKLGRWVRQQRDTFRSGSIKPHRYAKLESIGFPWNVHRQKKQQYRQGRPVVAISPELGLNEITEEGEQECARDDVEGYVHVVDDSHARVVSLEKPDEPIPFTVLFPELEIEKVNLHVDDDIQHDYEDDDASFDPARLLS